MARATQTTFTINEIPSYVLNTFKKGMRVELESIGVDGSPLKKGDRGTLCDFNKNGDLLVAWDKKGLFPIKMGRDLYWILNQITTICYGERQYWDSREEAMSYYLEGVMACEGSERDRYATIYAKLKEGYNYATDED